MALSNAAQRPTRGINSPRKKTGKDSARIIAPFWFARLKRAGQINYTRLRIGTGTDGNNAFAIGTPIRSHDGEEFNGHWQDEAVIIISVFADYVDASRRSHDPTRRTSEGILELLGNLGGEFL
jgi:hypothetical protein